MEASRADHVLSQPRAAYTLYEIVYSDLPREWWQIGPLIEKACAESFGAFSPESVIDGMRAGEYIMLGIVSTDLRIVSVLVCAIGTLPTKIKLLEVLLCGGEGMSEWLPFEYQIDDFARDRGCQRVRAIGRKSLARKLPHWKMIGVMLEREI